MIVIGLYLSTFSLVLDDRRVSLGYVNKYHPNVHTLVTYIVPGAHLIAARSDCLSFSARLEYNNGSL